MLFGFKIKKPDINLKKEQIIRYISLVLLFVLIQAFLLFGYSFLAVGWEDALARKLIFSSLIIVPVLLFFSFKAKHGLFLKILILVNWIVFSSAFIFSIFKPKVLSYVSYDLFLTQAAEVLNPAISLGYILFISTFILLIPLARRINFKNYLLFFIPIILWVIIRFYVVNSELSVFFDR